MPAAPRILLPTQSSGALGSPANPGQVAASTAGVDPLLLLANQQKQQLSELDTSSSQQIDTDWQTLVATPLGLQLTTFANQYQQALDTAQSENPDDPRATVPTTWLLDPSGGNVRNGLLASVKSNVGQFAINAQKTVAQTVVAATSQGFTDGQALLGIALQPLVDAAGDEVDPDQLLAGGVTAARKDARFGLLSNLMNAGGPLAQMLGKMPEETADSAYRNLLYGLGHGLNPKALVTDLQQIIGTSRSRALTISRTEMMGAYRSAQLDNYRANSNVVQGWIWLADLGSACPLCSDLNGEVHPLDDDMVSHPRCRCNPAPYTKSWDDILGPLGMSADELGLEDTSLHVESGSDWFARQSADVQRSVLGPAAFNAYKQGDLQLSDLVGRNADGSYYQKSLKEAGLNFRDYLPTSATKAVETEAESAVEQEVAHTAEVEAAKIARDAFSIEPLSADALKAEQEKALEAITPQGVADTAAEDAKARVSQEIADRLKDNPEFAKVRDVLEQQYRDSYALRNLPPEQVDARLAELLTPENVASSLLKSWASGDEAYFPLQQAVRDEFGLTNLARRPGTQEVRDSMALWQNAQPGLRAFVRAMYDNTQDWLKENNIEELVLYRGMAWTKLPKSLDASLFNGEAQEAQVALRAASSFSADMEQAINFANNPMSSTADDVFYQQVIAARVPAELILSTPQTGFGALDEYEAVVLGGKYDVMSVGVDNSGYYKGPNSYINSLDAVHQELTDTQVFGLLAQDEASSAASESASVAADTASVEGLGSVEQIQAREAEMNSMFQEALNPPQRFQEGESPADKSQQKLADQLVGNPAFQPIIDLYIDRQAALLMGAAFTPTRDEAASRSVYQLIMGYHTYAGGSSSASPLQIALQEAAREEFGVTSAAAAYSAEARTAALAEYADQMPGLQAFVRQMYDNTQADLAERGISEVQVFRGMAFKDGQVPAGLTLDGNPHSDAIALQPISSFSTSLDTAMQYANGTDFGAQARDYGAVLAGVIPADKVLSTGFTGFGAFYMNEVTTLGGVTDLLTIGAEHPNFALDDLYTSLSGGGKEAASASDLALREGEDAAKSAASASSAGEQDLLAARIDSIPAHVTSVPDIQDWLQGQLPGLQNVDLMSLDPQAARLVANASANLIQALPGVSDNILQIAATTTYSDALAYVPRDGLSLMLNTDQFADLAGLAERAPQWAAQGWWVGQTPEEIIGHEVGHLTQLNYHIADTTWNAAMAKVASDGGEPLVSEYAGNTVAESFAETFALLVYGDPTDAQLPIAREMAAILKEKGIDYNDLRAAVGAPPAEWIAGT